MYDCVCDRIGVSYQLIINMMKIFYEIRSVESSKKLSKLFDFMKEFPDIKDFRKQTILTCLEVCKDVGY